MVTSVATINSLLSQFQAVNTTIVNGTATGADVTDALDQRDTILQSLSQQIGVTTATNPNGSMSIYTDSGVTLFDTTPRSVAMQPTTTYSPPPPGKAVYVDGVPVTGANAVMPIQSGALAGSPICATRSRTQYQSQLDSIAGGLINAFAETSTASATRSPGLFTHPGASDVHGSTSTVDTGLAGIDRRSAPAPIPRRAAASTSSATAAINGAASQNTSRRARATTR